MSAQNNAQMAAEQGKNASPSAPPQSAPAAGAQGIDTPPTPLPTSATTSTASSKNKNKKKKNKKGPASIGGSSGATTPNPLDTPTSLTSVEPPSPSVDPPPTSSTLPPPVEKEADVAMETSRSAVPSIDLPSGGEVEELPKLESSLARTEVPAPAAPQAAGLFTDDGEQASFLDDTNPRDDIARAAEMDDVAAYTASTAIPPTDLPPARDADELPNFGDRVTTGYVAEPRMGVPAPMPLRGSELFADVGEQEAFLESTEPRDATFTQLEPEVVEQAEAAETSRDYLADKPVPTGDQLPSGVTAFFDDEAEEAAFGSSIDVDQAVTKAGDEHAVAAAEKEEDRRPPRAAATVSTDESKVTGKESSQSTRGNEPISAPATSSASSESAPSATPVESSTRDTGALGTSVLATGASTTGSAPHAQNSTPTPAVAASATVAKESSPTASTTSQADSNIPSPKKEPPVTQPQSSLASKKGQDTITVTESKPAPPPQPPADAPRSKTKDSAPAPPSEEHLEPFKPSSADALFDDDSDHPAFDIGHSEPSPVSTGASRTLHEPAAASSHSLFGDDIPAFDIGEQNHDAHESPKVTQDSLRHQAPVASGAHSLFGDDTPNFDIGGEDDASPVTATQVGVTAVAAAAAGVGAASLFGDNEDWHLEVEEREQEEVQWPEKSATSTDPISSDLPANDSIQSIFGGPDTTHDWLVDTSVDDSLNLGRSDMADEEPQHDDTSEDDIDAQVPEGWYDEAGEWNWYTDEEREQVRISMFGERSQSKSSAAKDSAQSAPEPEAPTSDPYAPSSAYRSSSTAVPPSNPYASAASSYASAPSAYAPVASPYAPAAVAPNPYAPPAPAVPPGGSYFPQQPAAAGGLFTPGIPQAPAGYTPAAATAPYGAPTPYNPTAPSPHGAQSSSYGPYAPAAQSAAAPTSAVPKQQPGPPKRVKSTAYDPPFIKQKSIARPPSAAPVESFTPMAAPPSAPSAPPPGPPKRSKTNDGGHSATAPPPAQPSGPAFSPRTEQPHIQSDHSHDSPSWSADSARDTSQPASKAEVDPYAPAPAADPYAPAPALDPYAPAPPSPMNPYNLAPLQKAEAPAQPPKRPSTVSSSHPPPKPTSFDPPLRSLSRPSSRHAQRPNFAAPPAAGSYRGGASAPPVPPIPSEFASQPPKGPSRHASPAPPSYAPPPPARSPPPRRGPSRGATATTPKFEAPPVIAAPPRVTSPPARGSSPTLHPPPRHGSPLTAPPRVTSPLRNEIKPKVRESLSLHEEFDPEGGAGGVWDEDSTDISLLPPQHSTPPGPPRSHDRHDEGDQETLRSEDTSPVRAWPRLDDPPKEQPYESSEPVEAHTQSYGEQDHSGYTPAAPPRKSSTTAQYDPYAPSSQAPHTGTSPAPSQKNPYSPSSPKQTTQQHAQPYNPYAPSSPKQKQQPVPEPYDPYGPNISPKQTQQQLSANMYNPYSASGRSSNEYSPATRQAGHSRQGSASSAQAKQAPVSDVYNPYAPSSTSPQQSYSPYAPGPAASDRGGSFSQPKTDEYNPYAARTSPVQSFTSPPGRQPSLPTQPVYDPYAPTSVSKQKGADLYSPGLDAYGARTTSPPAPNYFQSMGAVGPADSTYVPQQVLEQRPVSEDPLGRCNPSARNNPLAIFGFGGVLITSFPATAEDSPDAPSYGYGSHRGLISIRPVEDVVVSSALGTSSVAFPGPLVFDPAVAKGAAGEKKRREGVLSYLSDRAEEIERGLPYLKSLANSARREEEGKLAIMRILTAAIEGDGKLLGTPKAEEIIKSALQPPASSLTAATNGLICQAKAKNATPPQLAQLSSLLLTGDKKGAVHFAADAGLWPHALVIASAIGPDIWREIVARFTTAELGHSPESAGLNAAYSVFGGLQPSTVDDLFKAANITSNPSGDHWREVIAALFFNGKPTDLICLDELGSRLSQAGLRAAAQVCYLLSPNSPFNDMSPAAGERQLNLVEDARDEDGTVFSEIAEYARSLVPTPKGVEPPHASLPQLLPYKIQCAWRAAELGHVEQAKRYCDAIEAACKPTKNTRSRLPRHVAASMEDLLERLTGTPSIDPSAGIGMRKGKSGASLGSWIEGRLKDFIAGEDDEGPAKPAPKVTKSTVPIGPFSHFSTISPGPSADVSRAASSIDVNDTPSGFTAAEPSGGGYHPDDGGYTPYSKDEEGDDTPHAMQATSTDDDEAEFINPMANLNLGPAPSTNDYAPPAAVSRVLDDEDDDLGFGNSSLSRGRTPKGDDDDPKAKTKGKPQSKETPKKEEPKPAAKADAEPQAKSGWFGGWFKKGEGSGPIRAKLGEESSMVFDKELKRWVVKGTKAAPVAPAALAPPPRGKTASPTHQEASSQPPRPATGTPPVPPMPAGSMSRNTSARPSLTGAEPKPNGPPSRPPSTAPPSRTGTAKPGSSIDDLLSRPPSGRPASAAAKKKRSTNKYVDVFQGGA